MWHRGIDFAVTRPQGNVAGARASSPPVRSIRTHKYVRGLGLPPQSTLAPWVGSPRCTPGFIDLLLTRNKDGKNIAAATTRTQIRRYKYRTTALCFTLSVGRYSKLIHAKRFSRAQTGTQVTTAGCRLLHAELHRPTINPNICYVRVRTTYHFSRLFPVETLLYTKTKTNTRTTLYISVSRYHSLARTLAPCDLLLVLSLPRINHGSTHLPNAAALQTTPFPRLEPLELLGRELVHGDVTGGAFNFL